MSSTRWTRQAPATSESSIPSHTGLIKVTAVGGEDQEFLDLVKIKKLSRSELDSVNEQALADRPPGLHGQQGRLRQDAAR